MLALLPEEGGGMLLIPLSNDLLELFLSSVLLVVDLLGALLKLGTYSPSSSASSSPKFRLSYLRSPFSIIYNDMNKIDGLAEDLS